MQAWHHCAISLATPSDAVLTPQGILYDRETILQNLLRQKEQARQQLEKHTQREDALRKEHAVRSRERNAEQAKRDEALHHRVGLATLSPVPSDNTPGVPGAPKQPQNFWMPGARAGASGSAPLSPPRAPADDVLAIEARSMKRRKPPKISTKTKCPVTGQTLRLRDLITLNLTEDKANLSPARTQDGRRDMNSTEEREEALESEGKDAKGDAVVEVDVEVDAVESEEKVDRMGGRVMSEKDMFLCPVCHVLLTNAAKPVALRTGTVICLRCTEDFVRKGGTDPCTNAKIDIDKDIIVIKNGGTVFAASGSDPHAKEASIYRPSVT